MALLRFLVTVLAPNERSQTVVVFDAQGQTRGRPNQYQVDGIDIRFATNHCEADDLIEELIQACSTPQLLTVVSSDHRIQKAALRRRATPIDSAVWFDQRRLHARRQASESTEPATDDRDRKPESDPADAVEYWEAVFSEPPSDPNYVEPLSAEPSSNEETEVDERLADWNIFPPGYGDDLTDET